MKNFRNFAVIAALAFSFVSFAKAEDVQLNVTKTVQLPDRTLTPGSYIIHPVDASAHYVSVRDAQGRTLGFYLVNSTSRQFGKKNDVTTVATEGAPRISSVFVPGTTEGFEFVYGPQANARLTASTSSNVTGGSK